MGCIRGPAQGPIATAPGVRSATPAGPTRVPCRGTSSQWQRGQSGVGGAAQRRTSATAGASTSASASAGARLAARCQQLMGNSRALRSSQGTPCQSQRIQHRSRGRPQALFTGIVEEMGSVVRLEQEEQEGQVGWTLEVKAEETLGEAKLGDSIAVNGTCLTITQINQAASSFTFGLSPETLRCTSLGELRAGSPVNLERSLRPDSRMGGHFVQGHVDATGTIASFHEEGDSLWVRVKAPENLMPYIVPKGYIAVDGTSLTVCEVNDKDCSFTFMLVAYTQQKIVIPQKAVGNQVNLEVDILGKYVSRMMNAIKDDKRLQLS